MLIDAHIIYNMFYSLSVLLLQKTFKICYYYFCYYLFIFIMSAVRKSYKTFHYIIIFAAYSSLRLCVWVCVCVHLLVHVCVCVHMGGYLILLCTSSNYLTLELPKWVNWSLKLYIYESFLHEDLIFHNFLFWHNDHGLKRIINSEHLVYQVQRACEWARVNVQVNALSTWEWVYERVSGFASIWVNVWVSECECVWVNECECAWVSV
jgi:hypothetical protein